MIQIITCGKVSNLSLKELQKEYLTRIIHLTKVTLKELKKEHFEQKIKSYALEHSQEKIWLLSEEGTVYTSFQFSSLIKQSEEGTITFVIGPAEGFSTKLKKEFSLLSLSSLTMMHDLAQIVFLEQVYRAVTILKNLPYHKK